MGKDITFCLLLRVFSPDIDLLFELEAPLNQVLQTQPRIVLLEIDKLFKIVEIYGSKYRVTEVWFAGIILI